MNIQKIELSPSLNNNSRKNSYRETHQSQSFKRLLSLKFDKCFDPRKNIADLEALKAVKKSEALKQFFEKYNVHAVFVAMDRRLHYNAYSRLTLSLREIRGNSNTEKVSKNPFKNITKKIVSYIDSFKKPTDEICLYAESDVNRERGKLSSTLFHQSASLSLAKKIENIAFSELVEMVSAKRNTSKVLAQKAEEQKIATKVAVAKTIKNIQKEAEETITRNKAAKDKEIVDICKSLLG